MIHHRRLPALAAGSILAATAAVSAAAEERPAVALKAEACLRKNVDRVVADDPGLASAAEFLINYACSGEVAALARYNRNIAYVEIFSVLGRSNPPAPPAASGDTKAPPPPIDPKTMVNPETGDLNLPPSKPGAPNNGMASLLPMMNGLFGQLTSVNAPPELRKLAGELVLAARERQRTGKR